MSSTTTIQDINRVRLLAHRACHPGGQHSLCAKAELHLAIDSLAELAEDLLKDRIAEPPVPGIRIRTVIDPTMPEDIIEVHGAYGSVAKIRISKETK